MVRRLGPRRGWVSGSPRYQNTEMSSSSCKIRLMPPLCSSCDPSEDLQLLLISQALLIKGDDLSGEQVAFRCSPSHSRFAPNGIEDPLAQVEIFRKNGKVSGMEMLLEHCSLCPNRSK
jgi:hypothetical protein